MQRTTSGRHRWLKLSGPLWRRGTLYAKPETLIADIVKRLPGHDQFGLYADGQLKAYADLDRDLEQGEAALANLAVPLDAQRQGWGKALIAICEIMVREVGGERLSLFAPPQVQPFYEKQGYIVHAARNVEEDRDAARDADLFMVKWLNHSVDIRGGYL